MNQLSRMFDGYELTIYEQNGRIEFLLKDLCNILELGQVAGVKRRLDKDVISNHPLETSGGTQQATFVNEDGLYDVILDSRKPEAKRFRKWVTSEVLPEIRKNGSYQLDTSQLSPELQLMNKMVAAMAKNELETNEAKRLAAEANQSAKNISNIVSMNNVEWRDKVKVILRKIAKNWTGIEPYRSVINLSYEKLEKRAGCKLDIRLNNRKERAIAQGMSKSYVSKINKLDVISEEKRLVEIYIQVVKEMAIQFRVNINDFKFEDVI
ncbi:BRO-N domain-containing protein [Virgibacillus doumboii]|uniref:BRO-N domain-containing protein n=1 Tax=Virgibacillus doumboii TaxID=2697503 RepID=UPI001FE9BFD5|nr:BRO family protein [Virgibacillus doumboii]